MDAELILATLTDPQAERLTGGSSGRQQAVRPPGTRNNVSLCCKHFPCTAICGRRSTCLFTKGTHTELSICHVGSLQCDT